MVTSRCRQGVVPEKVSRPARQIDDLAFAHRENQLGQRKKSRYTVVATLYYRERGEFCKRLLWQSHFRQIQHGSADWNFESPPNRDDR